MWIRCVSHAATRSRTNPSTAFEYDRKSKLVEEQIPEVLLGFYELALSIKERREKDERDAREREEQERRRQEREALRDANQKLITQIEADAGAWHRARYLRRYIRAARHALDGQALAARFRDETIDYLDWAERYVNELDPLVRALRSGEFQESSSYHFLNDLDWMKKSFGRLLGGDWDKAFKLGQDYTPDPESDWRWPYRERSVFEVGSTDERADED